MSLQKLPTEDIRAGYKIEVHFDGKRTTTGPNNHLIVVYDSSGMKTGEGDVLMGFCPSCLEHVVRRPWPTEMDPDPTTFFCDKCKKPFPLTKMLDWLVTELTTVRLAERLTRMFQQLKGDVDIILKYNKNDIRYQSTDPNQAQTLARARSTREPSIYTLKRIMDDVHGGADLVQRFKAFLEA